MKTNQWQLNDTMFEAKNRVFEFMSVHCWKIDVQVGSMNDLVNLDKAF